MPIWLIKGTNFTNNKNDQWRTMEFCCWSCHVSSLPSANPWYMTHRYYPLLSPIHIYYHLFTMHVEKLWETMRNCSRHLYVSFLYFAIGFHLAVSSCFAQIWSPLLSALFFRPHLTPRSSNLEELRDASRCIEMTGNATIHAN